MRRLLATAALAVLILASALPALADTRVYVRVGPPRAIVETRVVAPGPHHVWIAGCHRWDGAAYVWVPGRWELPPRAVTPGSPATGPTIAGTATTGSRVTGDRRRGRDSLPSFSRTGNDVAQP